MYTPTKAQWQTVIDNFKKVLPMTILKHHLSMSETAVNDSHTCGTVHCVGGWYAVAALDLAQPLSYRDGAKKMSRDLGFEDDNKLEDWAGDNAYIWGNIHGLSMFSGREAYDHANTLGEVVAYLEGVRDRSPESLPKPMYTPTKKQWNTVIDNFKSILPQVEIAGKKHLDMMEPCVNNSKHKCGTIHCMAGWYAVATLVKEHPEEPVDFVAGKAKLATDLGFYNSSHLKEWAVLNPEIWGNRHATSMFTHTQAFDGAPGIPEIIEFLEKVRDRLPD